MEINIKKSDLYGETPRKININIPDKLIELLERYVAAIEAKNNILENKK